MDLQTNTFPSYTINSDLRDIPSEAPQPPHCSDCGANPRRTLRCRSVEQAPNDVLYLADVWVCEACGAEWVDEALERLNRWAAEAAASEEDDEYCG